jgi:hypothetical protein
VQERGDITVDSTVRCGSETWRYAWRWRYWTLQGLRSFRFSTTTFDTCATRPGPYTVRVRHFGPQEMNINMFVDGKGCGESQVRLGLGVFALRADKRRTGEQITSSSKWATFSGFRGGSTLVKGMELRCVSHPLG